MDDDSNNKGRDNDVDNNTMVDSMESGARKARSSGAEMRIDYGGDVD